MELPDRRVVVADQRENAVYLASFEGGGRRRLGRNGQGPHEYASLVGLFAGPADTAFAYDLKNARLAIVTPEGIPDVVTFRELGGPGVYPRFVDSRRRLYWDLRTTTRLQKRNDPGSSGSDQTPILRTDGNGGIDTLGTLATPGPVNPGPIPEWDYWSVGHDGRIAIVRNQDAYRVEWIAPDGSTTRGPIISDGRIRVGRADRDSLSRARTGGIGTAGGGSGTRRQVFLPARFPYAKAIFVSPAGRAWVERALPVADHRPLFDVFDRTGHRIARYRLPAGRVLVGFGREAVYATRTDDVGLQWVERYRIP